MKEVTAMKRCIITLIIVSAVLFSAGLNVFAEDIVLRFSTWQGMEEAFRPAFEELLARFEEDNPGIKIETIDIPFYEVQRQTLITISGGNPPDVMHLVAQWPFPFDEMGALEDLYAYYSEEELSNIPAGALDSGVAKGKLISVPWQLGSIFVVAWKDLLNQAGYDAIPDTWEEFVVAVEKISALGDDIYGMGLRTDKTANAAFWFFPVLWGFGGQFQDADGNLTVNSPEVLNALNWYKTLGENKMSPAGMNGQQIRVPWGQGKVGFLFDGPWIKALTRSASGLGEAADDKYLFGPFPKAPDGNRYAIGNNHVLSVSSQSEHKEAALKFVKYLTQSEKALFFYEAHGAVPGYKTLHADPRYSEDPIARIVIESAEFANCVPSKHPKLGQALEHLAVAMQAAFLGHDTQKALDTAEKAIQETFGQ
jgi:ABC-type glycerol-3-phosphate transport system substrate-binding protein